MKTKSKMIVSGVAALLVLIFLLQNAAVVKVNFLFWSLSMSRSLLILLFVGVGMLLGWLLSGYISIRLKK